MFTLWSDCLTSAQEVVSTDDRIFKYLAEWQVFFTDRSAALRENRNVVARRRFCSGILFGLPILFRRRTLKENIRRCEWICWTAERKATDCASRSVSPFVPCQKRNLNSISMLCLDLIFTNRFYLSRDCSLVAMATGICLGRAYEYRSNASQFFLSAF